MSSPDFRDDFNARGRESLLAQATSLRKGLIESVVDVFKSFQIEDNATIARRLGKYQLWLATKSLEVPGLRQDLQESRSFALVNKTGDQRLRFYVPVPEDFEDEDEGALERFEIPSHVYVERSKLPGAVGQTAVHYAVNALQMFEYRQSTDESPEEVGPLDLWTAFDETDFDSGINPVSGLSQDLINWHAVKQREFTVGPDGQTTAIDLQ